ncbi:hypothetical protein CBL_05727 [Carabus blaptoides fortunei]
MFGTYLILFIIFTVTLGGEQNGVGYSYHKFSGPVSGDIKEVLVPRSQFHHGAGHSVDYVAKPDYSYVYGVEDPYTGNKQSHQESRDGDAVNGQYSVMEPDGSLRIVKYTADDKNGFQVKVEYVKPGSH